MSRLPACTMRSQLLYYVAYACTMYRRSHSSYIRSHSSSVHSTRVCIVIVYYAHSTAAYACTMYYVIEGLRVLDVLALVEAKQREDDGAHIVKALPTHAGGSLSGVCAATVSADPPSATMLSRPPARPPARSPASPDHGTYAVPSRPVAPTPSPPHPTPPHPTPPHPNPCRWEPRGALTWPHLGHTPGHPVS